MCAIRERDASFSTDAMRPGEVRLKLAAMIDDGMFVNRQEFIGGRI
jgi:hypothetical protein